MLSDKKWGYVVDEEIRVFYLKENFGLKSNLFSQVWKRCIILRYSELKFQRSNMKI